MWYDKRVYICRISVGKEGDTEMICTACPRRCKVERTENAPSKGFCKMPYNAVIARAALHFWEEP